jgi:hypothetical protein
METSVAVHGYSTATLFDPYTTSYGVCRELSILHTYLSYFKTQTYCVFNEEIHAPKLFSSVVPKLVFVIVNFVIISSPMMLYSGNGVTTSTT